tara:strand:- start:18621 stop:19148 length:528 start_codon:yes stop_codon:yes gene_type:complete
MKKFKKAIFLDRDGVLNKPIKVDSKVSRPPWTIDEIYIFKSAYKLVEIIKNSGYLPVVVTNQPDVGRGDVEGEIINLINQNIMKILNIEYSFICPHGNDNECDCRKPKPGMLITASKKYNLDLNSSFMIGDRDKDIYAGINAGTKTIFLSNKSMGKENYLCRNHAELIELLEKIL